MGAVRVWINPEHFAQCVELAVFDLSSRTSMAVHTGGHLRRRPAPMDYFSLGSLHVAALLCAHTAVGKASRSCLVLLH